MPCTPSLNLLRLPTGLIRYISLAFNNEYHLKIQLQIKDNTVSHRQQFWSTSKETRSSELTLINSKTKIQLTTDQSQLTGIKSRVSYTEVLLILKEWIHFSLSLWDLKASRISQTLIRFRIRSSTQQIKSHGTLWTCSRPNQGIIRLSLRFVSTHREFRVNLSLKFRGRSTSVSYHSKSLRRILTRL